MNTKLLDLDDVRRKETSGAVPPGTSDALIDRGRRIEFARGEPAYEVNHDWWRKQTGAPPRRRQRTRRRRRRGIAIPGPGTALAALIKLLTLGIIQPCTGCRSRARRLNRLGWCGLFYGAMGMLGFVDGRWERLRH